MSMSCHPHYKSGSSLFCRLTSRRVEDCQDCGPVAHENSQNTDPDAVRRRTDLVESSYAGCLSIKAIPRKTDGNGYSDRIGNAFRSAFMSNWQASC
jgi:hypothetical protein